MIVIRGYILPKRGPNNSPLYTESIDDESAKLMFEELTDLVRGILDVFTDNGKKRINNSDELSLFLDSLVAYFKSLAFIDPFPPEKVPIILPVSLQSLCIYLIRRELLSKHGLKPYTASGLNKLEEISKYSGEIVRLYSDEKRKKFYNILRFPADTRPGANTSSLLIHSLTSSALASTYYINTNGIDENLLIIRLAAIFHDMGKLLDWHRHEEVSSKKIKELFGTYVEGYAENLVLEASDLISNVKHPLREFLIYGDRNSSELDRVAKLFFEIIRKTSIYKDFEECLKEYAKAGFEEAYKDWSFWSNYVKEDLLRRLTEEFCKRASVIDEENPIFIEKGKIIDENVVFTRIDIRRIQQFIKVNNLWAMNGASRLIDLILYVGIPAYLIDTLKLPLENILYFGGGNETIVFPKKLIGENNERLHLFVKHFNNEFFKDSPSKIVFGTSSFHNSFRSINSTIDKELVINKIRYEGPQKIDPNIYKKCEFCGKVPATKLSNKGDTICKSCEMKFYFGRMYHFKVRADLLGLEWEEKLSNYVIEYIAGHSRQGPKPGEEYLDISMIKFDGILIGQIMGSSISLTDACERSFRIDFSVKEGIRTFMRNLNEEDDLKRIVLGLMYVGGDDGVILLPSRLSIPFALNLMNEYYLNMGCKSALSVGIMAAKPKHPLIRLYEACDSLLGIAKEGARKDCYEKLHKTALTVPSNSFRGSIAFLTADGGWATFETVKAIVNEAESEGISRMKNSYFLSDASNHNSILRLINMVEYDNKRNLEDINIKSLLEIVGEGKSDSEKDRKIYRLKEIRKAIHDIFASSKLNIEPGKIEFIYMVKEAETAPNGIRIIMKEMISQAFQKINDMVNLNLYDLLLLIKLLGGGKL